MRAKILLTMGMMALGAVAITAQRETAQREARFSTRSELVVLNVAVTDGRGAFVGGLPADAFRVLEERRPQMVSFFAEQDAPASIALLIDASGSMLVTRDRMIAGITSLAELSHPDDEFLPLVFNERVTYVVPSESHFTSDPRELRDALTNSLNVQGRTAFHDALAEGLEGISHGQHERRVLILLSDGGDNASHSSFNEMLEKVQASNVVIYTIALLDPLSLERNPKGLRRLAEVTGGLAFEPRSVSMVGKVLRSIAADIRSRYTLAYEPAESVADGRLKRVSVLVHAPGHNGLKVRTRTGYVSGTPATPVDDGEDSR
jgi:VWFA-related protein